MDTISRLRAMAAFCTQRSKMEGEDTQFWLNEANDRSTRLSNHSGNKTKRIASRKTRKPKSLVT